MAHFGSSSLEGLGVDYVDYRELDWAPAMERVTAATAYFIQFCEDWEEYARYLFRRLQPDAAFNDIRPAVASYVNRGMSIVFWRQQPVDYAKQTRKQLLRWFDGGKRSHLDAR